MGRRTKYAPTLADLLRVLADKLRPPFGVVLGSPREAADLIGLLKSDDAVCYQMDLYQAERLQEALAERRLAARVVTAPDLWDLSPEVQTLLYPAPEGGERELKLDLVEQAFHVLRPRGRLVVLSPYPKDQLFPAALKKVFGRVHAPGAGDGMIYWAQRDGDRPRRRHEVTFQVSAGDRPSLRFLSRPGVFAYGRFDEGARALVETMDVRPGDRVLDVGCGCGTNGVHAGLRSGPDGWTTFVDSNLRAVALAEHNARANGLTRFQTVASSTVAGPEDGSFDVALANPPYYGQLSIARLFIERSRRLLRPGGRFYLVTRQPDQVGPVVAESFGPTEPVEKRGYIILCALRPAADAAAPGQGKPVQ
jgi:16S rRNA (guanine1207-N2)-methyltransferase